MDRYDRWSRREERRYMAYDAGKKSALLAYLLWFFLGTFGIHRFYLGRIFTGLMMLGLTVMGSITAWILVGYIPLGIVFVWWLLDALLTYHMVEQYNGRLARRYSY